MLATVGFARLNLPHYRHPVTGTRLFAQIELSQQQIDLLRNAAAAGLGIVD